MRVLRLLLLLVIALAAVPAPTPAAAQSSPICFPGVPGIADCIDPAFAPYWRSNGALPVFGYPIGPREQYQPPDASAPIVVQWTERNRLELHPQNPPAYRVLLGRMGAERLAQLGRNPAAELVEEGPQEGCLWFAETRHNVCDQAPGLGFKSYWESNGLQIPGLGAYERSLALFGLPLTAAQPEPSADGSLVLTQWFERARLEWHPDNPDEYKVLLGLLGREVRPGAGPAQPASDIRGGRSIFGVEVNRGTVSRVYPRLAELQPGWVRYNGVVWSEVEARPGQRDWSKLATTDAELTAIANAGGTPMLIVRGAPTWAAARPDKSCGLISPAALDEFAAFLGDLVARYSVPPYNVKYWELGNEPDVDPDLVAGNSPYGCWGEESDPGYGGAGYAAMLAAAYPAIKAADPEAQVVLGGLLLDCDPEHSTEQLCPSGRFLEGVLAAGGGEHFDIAAYHAYSYWGDTDSDWDLLTPKWVHRGGALLGKLDFVRDTMARYGYAKPVVMNEGGLLCYGSSPLCAPAGFYEDQANYVVRSYARAHSAGLLSVIWYTLNGPGWQEGGMLDRTQAARPAFQAALFVKGLLDTATYAGGGIEGALERYIFRKGETTYTLFWTNDGSSVELSLPEDTRAVYTVDGKEIGLAAPIQAGFEPLIAVSGP